MSDVVAAAGAAAPDAAKLKETERVVGDILRLMEFPAKLELKDSAPSHLDKGQPGISVAVLLESEPAVAEGAPGKRSSLSESLQFLVNKMVNPQGAPPEARRWVSVAVGGHPEPRPAPAPKKEKAPQVPQQHAQADAANGAASGAKTSAQAPQAQGGGRNARGAKGAPQKSGGAAARVDETKLEVAADEAMTTLVQSLTGKSAKHGRFYALVGLSTEDRARLVQAAPKDAEASVSLEGEGKARRLVFTPAKPLPMPKWEWPDYDDEEEDDDEAEA